MGPDVYPRHNAPWPPRVNVGTLIEEVPDRLGSSQHYRNESKHALATVRQETQHTNDRLTPKVERDHRPWGGRGSQRQAGALKPSKDAKRTVLPIPCRERLPWLDAGNIESVVAPEGPLRTRRHATRAADPPE